jgi:ADP-heptose:LPS heptosyltransferase
MRILLCHRLNLGDLVCASPGIQWLRQKHPQVRFRLIANEFAARVGALIPEVEQVYPFRKFDRSADPEWRQMLRARAWRPDRVIGLSPSPDWKLGLRMRLLGPSESADFSGAPEHAAERLAWLFGWRRVEPLPSVRLRQPEFKGAARNVAIWISARKPSNRPTPDQVIRIVRALRARRHGASIGVFGLPERTDSSAHLPDVQAQSALRSMLRAEGLDLATPPLDLLLGEIAASDSLISPDGGIAHVAAGFGIPVVALFGNVDPLAWRPWSPRAKVLQAASRRVADLDAEAVADAWEESVASPA